MRAAVVVDGDLDASALVRAASLLGAAPWLVIAADGGAVGAERVGLRPDLVVGDADSLTPAEIDDARSRGIPVLIWPSAKDETDTELALREALGRGARSVAILGAFGGSRLEHALANVALLALPELDTLDVALVDGRSTVRRVGRRDGPGELVIDGRPGDYVSLLPLDDPVDGVTTDGLRYPLAAERLSLGPSRGVSNELLADRARVATAGGRLLVVHTDRASESRVESAR